MRIDRSMSAGNKRTLLLSLAVTAVLSLLPISSHAAIFWDDELEAGNTGYSGLLATGSCGGLPSFQYDTVNKVSGAASLKETFPGTPQYHQLCGGFADRSFPATDDLWTRYYIRLAPGWVTDYIGTKLMRNSTTGVQSHWWNMLWGTTDLMVTLQNYPTVGAAFNFYANVGSSALRTSPEGQWVCIETRIKNNTVGQADGAIEAYRNGVKILHYTGLEIKRVSAGTQNDQFVYNRTYRQDGGGSINYDRLAVGNTRIGCLGAVPASDSTPPAPPVGLTVR